MGWDGGRVPVRERGGKNEATGTVNRRGWKIELASMRKLDNG